MENEDMILDQMENTRCSLSEKLQTLEDKVSNTVDTVTNTVDSATHNVADTVEAVQETVANMKDSVQDTINAVKDSVKDSVDAFKDAFDIPGQVQRHPWPMLGGSVALGYCLGTFLASKQEATPNHQDKLIPRPLSLRSNENGNHENLEAQGSAGLFQKLAPELEQLKGLAIGALMGTFRDMILPSVPQTFGESLNDIINNVTEKLGGTSFPQEPRKEEAAPSNPETDKDSPNIFGSRWAKAN